MLLINQQVDYDFANKETIYIDSFKYKQGEVDGNGIDLTLKNISPKPNTFFLVNWLYRDQYDYVYIPNLSTEVQGDKVVVYPPQAVLRPGVVGFEIIAVEIENGVPVGQLIGPTIIVPVAPSLVSDGDAVIEDADISKTVEIISDQTELKNAIEALNSWLTGKENARKTEETRRQNLASQKAGELDTAKSNLDTAIASANSATSNANAKAALADTAATNANTAATNANASATATNTSATNANTAKSNADAKKTLADTAKTNADGKKTLADQKKALADTAKSNADTKKAAADANAVILEGAPAEVTAARVAGDGVTHDSLKKSLDANFVELSSRIPTNVGVSGIENVTVNNSLAGEVSGVELTGRTLVNIRPRLPLPIAPPQSATQTTSMAEMHSSDRSYTIFCDFEVNEDNVNGQILRLIYETGHTEAMLDQTAMKKQRTSKVTLIQPQGKGKFLRYQFGYVRPGGLNTATARVIIHGLVILEGDHTDKPLSFFEGLKSSELETVMTHGVNLVDMSRVKSGFIFDGDSIIESGGGSGWYDVLDVKTSKTTRLIFENKNGLFSHNYGIVKRDGTRVQYSTHNKNFLVVNRVYPFDKIVSYTLGTAGHKVAISMYEVTGSEPSTYIPYQSSTTTLPSPIKLRSLPNGVADTYDVDTQTLTRRCGEVVLNGSESWRWLNGDQTESLIWFSGGGISNISLAKPLGITSDKLVGKSEWENTKEGIYTTSIAEYPVLIYITKSKLPTPDVAGFKAWLAQNPTTVVYQLAEPTTEYIENNGQLRSYDNQTTISVDSAVPCDIKANVPISFKSAINSIAQTNLSIEQPSLPEVQTQQEQNADELTALQLAIVDLYEERI